MSLLHSHCTQILCNYFFLLPHCMNLGIIVVASPSCSFPWLVCLVVRKAAAGTFKTSRLLLIKLLTHQLLFLYNSLHNNYPQLECCCSLCHIESPFYQNSSFNITWVLLAKDKKHFSFSKLYCVLLFVIPCCCSSASPCAGCVPTDILRAIEETLCFRARKLLDSAFLNHMYYHSK